MSEVHAEGLLLWHALRTLSAINARSTSPEVIWPDVNPRSHYTVRHPMVTLAAELGLSGDKLIGCPCAVDTPA